MKEIGIFIKNATSLDRDYAQDLLTRFRHLEYIKKKLLPDMELVERDSETGIMTYI